MKTLAQQFHDEMEQLYYATADATRGIIPVTYWPRRHRQEVKKYGGVEAAKKRLIRRRKPGSGFGKIEAIGRLDLSVEYLVLQPRWRSLFTAEERQIARDRLREAGMKI